MEIYNTKNDYSFHNFLNNNPSLSILLGLLIAFTPCVYFSEYPISLILVLSLFIIFILSLFLNKKVILKILFWCIVGFFTFSVKNTILHSDYSLLFCRGDCGAQIKGILIDPGIMGKDVPWMPNPKYLKMNVQAIRFSDDDRWRETYGETIVYFSGKTKYLKYGELLELAGCFVKPDSALIPGSFDYRDYLRSTGINRIFICSKYESLKQKDFPYSVFRTMYLVRDKALNLLCKGIKSQNVKTFLAGFFFGCRQGINNEVKQNFLRSGTIHILAISGLHVGVLSLILLLILRPLPITVRFLIVPILLLCYVSLTGFRPSGVRALLMISILCFHRAFYYSFSPVNSIAFAAVLILLINPFAIGNIGFQFSFVVAGLLIFSWEKVNSFLLVISEKNRWKIQNGFSLYAGLKKYLYRKIVLLVCTCIIAGVGATGLVLYYQNLFIPLMFITNIIILPLLFPLFLIGFLKIIITFFLGSFAFIFNYLLSAIVSFILLIAEYGASSYYTNYLKKPSVILLILFYALLLLFFITNSNKKRIMSFCILTVIFSFWIFNHIFSPGFISIIQEKGNNPPVMIIKSSPYSNPIIVNCSNRLGFVVLEKLRMEGINRIECVVMTGASNKFSGGIAYLIEKMGVRKLVIPDKIHKNRFYNKIIELCRAKNISIVFISNLEEKKFSNMNSDFKIDISNMEVKFKVRELNPGNKKVSIKINDLIEKVFYIKNSNQNQIFEAGI